MTFACRRRLHCYAMNVENFAMLEVLVGDNAPRAGMRLGTG